MKQDRPFPLEQFLRLASERGYFVHQDIGPQRLTVIALEATGDLLRMFHPELRPIPDGTQLNGSLGLALRTVQPIKGSEYDLAIFHNILNYDDLSDSSRILEDTADIENFLNLLRSHLLSFPHTIKRVLEWSRSDNWLAKQVSWQRPLALAFLDRAADMCSE